MAGRLHPARDGPGARAPAQNLPAAPRGCPPRQVSPLAGLRPLPSVLPAPESLSEGEPPLPSRWGSPERRDVSGVRALPFCAGSQPARQLHGADPPQGAPVTQGRARGPSPPCPRDPGKVPRLQKPGRRQRSQEPSLPAENSVRLSTKSSRKRVPGGRRWAPRFPRRACALGTSLPPTPPRGACALRALRAEASAVLAGEGTGAWGSRKLGADEAQWAPASPSRATAGAEREDPPRRLVRGLVALGGCSAACA